MKKRIELCKMRAGDIKTGFGNPRKIKPKELEKLAKSMEDFGDFGIYLIDEHDNVIAGNQRLKVVLNKYGDDTMLDCKRLIGYSEAELRAINIKDNTHAGDWDFDMLANWTADITVDLGLKADAKKDPDKRKIKELEPIRYERYDYVMIVCRNEVDYLQLTKTLGIDTSRTIITPKRSIKARAIWYDDMKAQIIPKEDVTETEENEK